MAENEFETMDLVELRALRSQLDEAIARKLAADKAAMKQKLHDMLAAAGLDLDDVLGTAKPRRPQVVRYRDPDNPGNTWNGRGRQPDWLFRQIQAGARKEDFAVEREVVPHVNGAG